MSDEELAHMTADILGSQCGAARALAELDRLCSAGIEAEIINYPRAWIVVPLLPQSAEGKEDGNAQ
jgi:hypothetical protein